MKELQEWKLKLMVETIFRNISRDANNKNEIKRILIEGIKIDEKLGDKIKKRIKILSDLVEEESGGLLGSMLNAAIQGAEASVLGKASQKLIQ